MECNRDEATRAKEIAEKKFASKDIAGAKKLALKAQNLYPGLEGLPHMLATFDVYLSAENKIIGELDWYGILGVNPVADDDSIRKQYKKLALMLHPDKNKSVGGDGAFKMISEAMGVLSDKNKRNEYDQRRFSRLRKVPFTGGAPSVPSGTNGFHNFSNNASSKSGAQKTASRGGPSTAAPSRQRSTFWTACNRCKMQYEYVRVYLNCNLLCPNCHEPFLAFETAAPPSNGSSSSAPWPSSQQRQKSNQHTSNKNIPSAGFTGHDSFNQTNQWGPFSKTTGTGNATASPSTAAQAASVVQQAYEKVKREREVAQAAARRQVVRRKTSGSKRAASNLSPGFFNAGSRSDLKGERPNKRRSIQEEARCHFGGNAQDRMATGNETGIPNSAGFKQGSLDRDKASVPSVPNKPNSTRELSQFELRHMLAEKAKREIRKKLMEWSLSTTGKATQKEKRKEKDAQKDSQTQTVARNTDSTEQQKLAESVDLNEGVHLKKELLNTSGVDLDTEARDPMSISVPDPDFHDFDRDRSEKSFGDNQVWAAYDDDDGMPRYYALIHSVISRNPFKMRISWLNSKTNSELGPLNWIGSGFAKTCGDFRVGRYEINNSLNSFSHRVNWTKGARGAVRLFPGKGDVWALYRNWSPDWNELTPDEVIHKYDMVEVIDEYNEEQGMLVTPLVKVAGFKTVFHRHLDPREVKRIPREEMFRFSHQVPSYLLTGSEAQDAPKGCRELDPAATPLELLQVITEVKEEEIVEPAVEKEITEAEVLIVDDDGVKAILETKGRKMVENAEEQITTETKETVGAEKQITREIPEEGC
ncbi:hypothetical protein IFM89_006532 [Coptis chinensis]|uniref:J domain-containing protein n=1 Tax=Coptis chinensis TaxID=261450 RepID=A0A835M4Y2_9MAGN|nr:hypothetical protein IFM89_006532 [Coptis chinensis]